MQLLKTPFTVLPLSKKQLRWGTTLVPTTITSAATTLHKNNWRTTKIPLIHFVHCIKPTDAKTYTYTYTYIHTYTYTQMRGGGRHTNRHAHVDQYVNLILFIVCVSTSSLVYYALNFFSTLYSLSLLFSINIIFFSF